MKLEELTKKYKIYIDLDGVLSNLDKKVKEVTGKYLASSKLTPRYSMDKRHVCWGKIGEYIDIGNEFWEALEMMPDGQELWDYVKSHKPEILTALYPICPGKPDDKIEWVHRNLGDGIVTNVVSLGEDKSRYATPWSILIDDKPENIDAWKKNNGVGIVHTNTTNTIKNLKNLGI